MEKMEAPKSRVLLIQLTAEEPRSISHLESVVAALPTETFTVDNYSGSDVIDLARRFLSTEGRCQLIIWREGRSSWGNAQPILQDVMRHSNTIDLVTNEVDPMLSRLQTKLRSYNIITDEQELVTGLQN